jgi:two-component system response regulator YesN
MSQILHVSDDYLGRLFRLQTGQSFREFLRDVRLREALRLLQQSDHAIKVISAIIGYSDPSHFIRYFYKLTGSTPAAFRDRERTMKRALLSNSRKTAAVSSAPPKE